MIHSEGNYNPKILKGICCDMCSLAPMIGTGLAIMGLNCNKGGLERTLGTMLPRL